MQIVAKVDTYLKAKDLDSQKLGAKDKVLIRAGTKIGAAVLPAIGQSLHVTLAGNIASLGLRSGSDWYVYREHWETGLIWKKDAKPANIRLNVPYYSQNDTGYEGGRQCFSHACSMLVDYVFWGQLAETASANGYPQPEQYYNYVRDKFGDTTDNTAQIRALEALAINAYFTQTLSPKDLYLCLARGLPVPIGVAYKTDGHWVLCVGYEDGNWLIHDPHGIRKGILNQYLIYSTDKGREGAYDKYSQDIMDAIYWDQARDSEKEAGWAIVTTHLKGQATGIPETL